MAKSQLEVAGVTLTLNENGVELAKNWFFSQQISAADAQAIRDWLLTVYPIKGKCKCQPQ